MIRFVFLLLLASLLECIRPKLPPRYGIGETLAFTPDLPESNPRNPITARVMRRQYRTRFDEWRYVTTCLYDIQTEGGRIYHDIPEDRLSRI